MIRILFSFCFSMCLFSFESIAFDNVLVVEDTELIDNNEEIDVLTLNEYLCNETPCVVLDVREKKELDICCLNNIMHIPLNELLLGAVDGLSKDVLLIVMCRSGKRSLQAVNYLKNNGFDKVVNLKGGILDWIKEIDPTLKAY
jgi:rhodanese-related sulfurtransferase